MERLFQGITEQCKKTEFLEEILKKAHYGQDDRELIWSALEQVLARMDDGANWNACDAKTNGAAKAQAVVMTLGAGVDQLQEEFLGQGKLSEAYAVEVLGSEILLLAYAAYNAWVKEHSEFVVKRYHFLGTGEHGLEELPDVLAASGLPVTCTEGYCMVPKKSVAFYAELTQDRTVTCEGICMGCGRVDCPNRMATGDRLQGNRALDRPLTYGYARILGLPS